MLSKEDILSEFKRKINEAISLVSQIPVEEKAEVWNFWELITITVKLFTQVYVEDHVGKSAGRRSERCEGHVDKSAERRNENNLQKSHKDETLTEKKAEILVSHEKNVKKKIHPDETEVSDNEINVRCESDPVSDSDHNNTDPVRSEIKTLDFTDLISCPSSVEPQQQDGSVTMYIQSQTCNTPSMSTSSQMEETLDSSLVNSKRTDSVIETENDIDNQRENVICVEIISTDDVTPTMPTEKENKIPPLNLRKVRKKDIQGNSNENTYIIAKGDNNISEARPSRRKSSRPTRKVQNKDYLYEENNVAKKSGGVNATKNNTVIPNNDGTYKCYDCDKILSNLTALKAHSRKHTGQRPFSCRICGRAFSTNGNRVRHEIGHKGEKNFQCGECQKWFTTAKNLQIHTRVHTGEKPYVCDICDKRFTQLGSLKSHIDLHKGEKRYLCPVCGRAFTQKTNLESHVLRHNKNNRQFKCQHCTHSCFTKGELERHSLKHSKDKPYLCDFCPKSFTRAQYLKEHKTLHVKSKPYSCQKCTETFPDISSLRKHKNWHKVQEAEQKQAEGEITAEEENEDVQQTCIVTTSGVTGMKQIIMATDKDLPADVLQQFVDSAAQMESDSMSVTHMVPVVAEMDLDGNITHVDNTDDGSQDIYQITFLDTNSDSEHSNIITAVDFSAMNLLANATTHQFN